MPHTSAVFFALLLMNPAVKGTSTSPPSPSSISPAASQKRKSHAPRPVTHRARSPENSTVCAAPRASLIYVLFTCCCGFTERQQHVIAAPPASENSSSDEGSTKHVHNIWQRCSIFMLTSLLLAYSSQTCMSAKRSLFLSTHNQLRSELHGILGLHISQFLPQALSRDLDSISKSKK